MRMAHVVGMGRVCLGLQRRPEIFIPRAEAPLLGNSGKGGAPRPEIWTASRSPIGTDLQLQNRLRAGHSCPVSPRPVESGNQKRGKMALASREGVWPAPRFLLRLEIAFQLVSCCVCLRGHPALTIDRLPFSGLTSGALAQTDSTPATRMDPTEARSRNPSSHDGAQMLRGLPARPSMLGLVSSALLFSAVKIH
jgi:hypothetical protein